MAKFISKITDCLILGFHFFKVSLQIIYGTWKISKLPQPVVCIFGGHLLQPDSPYLKQAQEMARLLVKNNISVLTGGGPGIMEAANAGAAQQKKGVTRSMGIGVRGLRGEEGLNPYVHDSVILDDFFARKYLMIYYSMGFIVFPGGIGTMDELSELLNLIQTGKRKSAPVILINVTYWQPYLEQLKKAQGQGLLLQHGAIDTCIQITDDLDYAVHVFLKEYKREQKEA